MGRLELRTHGGPFWVGAGALIHFTAATEVAPDVAAPWLELAGEHHDAGQFEAALALLRKLFDRGLSGAPGWLVLGVTVMPEPRMATTETAYSTLI